MSAPADGTDTLVRRALNLAQLGRLNAAVDLVRQVLAEDPDNVFALEALAYCYGRADRYPQMYETITRAAAISPDHPGVQRSLARALTGLGRGREAVATAERARTLAPEDFRAELVLASALLGLGGTAAVHSAAAATARARRLAPDTAEVHIAEGNVQRRMAEFGRARAAYEQALRIDPENVSALHSLAILDSDRGRALRASPALSGTLSAAPANARALASARVGARRAWWLLTDLGCLMLLVCLVLSNVPRSFATGPAANAAAVAVVLAGAVLATGFVGWRVRRLPPATRTLLSDHRWRFTFLTAPLRMAGIAIGGVIFAADPAPTESPSAAKTLAIFLLTVPMFVLLLRARNSLVLETALLVRRLWFRATRPAR